jgi:hypothetical protein
MDNSAFSGVRLDNIYHRDVFKNHHPSKLKTYGFIIAIIVGIGGLAIGGAGVVGHFHVGALSSLDQIDAIIMMAIGGGGGAILFIIGIVGTVKNRKTIHRSESHSKNRNTHSTETSNHQDHHSGKTNSVRQGEFIERAGRGTIRDAQRFGKAQWEIYFGAVGDEPSLPKDIDEILNSPCPFSGDEGIKVKDTHMLMLVPATVNGQALSLDTLQRFIQNPKKGNKTNYCSYDNRNSWTQEEHGKAIVHKSYWVLMTKDVIPGSRNQIYREQEESVRQCADQGYVLPGALEAALCISLEFVVSGEYLYGCAPLTYTCCSQVVKRHYPVLVGGFTSAGLQVNSPFYSESIGAAALRKF